MTIIREVKGNARALCHSLTSLLGVGGTVHSKGSASDVEVQGEQTERVQSALQQLACVRGGANPKCINRKTSCRQLGTPENESRAKTGEDVHLFLAVGLLYIYNFSNITLYNYQVGPGRSR